MIFSKVNSLIKQIVIRLKFPFEYIQWKYINNCCPGNDLMPSGTMEQYSTRIYFNFSHHLCLALTTGCLWVTKLLLHSIKLIHKSKWTGVQWLLYIMGLQALKCPPVTRYPLTETASNQINFYPLSGTGYNEINPFSTTLFTDLPLLVMLNSLIKYGRWYRYIFPNKIVELLLKFHPDVCVCVWLIIIQ